MPPAHASRHLKVQTAQDLLPCGLWTALFPLPLRPCPFSWMPSPLPQHPGREALKERSPLRWPLLQGAVHNPPPSPCKQWTTFSFRSNFGGVQALNTLRLLPQMLAKRLRSSPRLVTSLGLQPGTGTGSSPVTRHRPHPPHGFPSLAPRA